MTRSFHLFFLSIPGLRPRDVDGAVTPTLWDWANRGAMAELVPTFPCVTSPVQANMITGTPANKHGVIANGFFHRDRHEVEFWTGTNHVMKGKPIWEVLRERNPGFTTAVWHAQNIKGASADYIVTPAPIHGPDGSTKLWCYSKPEGLYQQLLDIFGHFPLQHYWGPLSNIESTKWILKAAAWLHQKHAPNLHWIYIPHLDYAAQKFGPNSEQAKKSLTELDTCLCEFEQQVAASPTGKNTVFLATGEYALTDVTGVIYPNRILRNAGLLNVWEREGAEYLDLANSAAFAVVDHQLAHVYLHSVTGAETAKGRSAPSKLTQRVTELFRNLSGISGVYVGDQRAEIGLDHERSGDIILVSEDTHWFAYYWWLDDRYAPPFARTVDIHQKPGYDPVELFFDPVTKGIPLNGTLVKGSHGHPAVAEKHRTALISNIPIRGDRMKMPCRDTDLCGIILSLFGG